MQLPSIVKQLGYISGENRVYIEDYVYTYLNTLKEERTPLPSRVALYGYANMKDGRHFYFIYGASHVIEELEQGKSEEDVRLAFFNDYQLIGYVNIYNESKELPGKKEGYYIFYETNEAMQNYLLACHKRKDKMLEKQKEIQDEGWKELKNTPAKGIRRRLSFFQNLFLGICVGITALAVSTFNNFGDMEKFISTTDAAIAVIENSK